MENFDRIGDSAVVEGGNQDHKQPGSSAKRRHDTCKVERDDPFMTCQGDNNQGPKRPRMESSRKQKMVCQYMKYDPAKYSTWRTCPGPGFDGINRLKEHLKRRHFKEFSCARCGQQFGTTANLHEHTRALKACEVAHGWQHIGYMTQLQWDDIRKRRGQGTSDEERWKAIYKILFPDVDVGQIPSPFPDAPEAIRRPGRLIDHDEYDTYLRRNLPQRFMAQLSVEFQDLEEGHRQRMADIVQEQIDELLTAAPKDQGVAHYNEELPKLSSAEEALVQECFFWEPLGTADAVHTDPLGEWPFAD